MTTKTKRGRPTLQKRNVKRVQIRVCFTLYEGEDDDLIDWFDSIPHRKKPSYLKTALRQGGFAKAETNDEDSELISDDLLDDLLGSL